MMVREGGTRFPWRGFFLIWVGASAFLIALMRVPIMQGTFNDPDDYMRLLQVRDLLAGQSWFDLTQHRVNPPYGLPMHWSRLVDLPLAGLMTLLRPVAGPLLAERIAVTIVPLLTLAALVFANLLQIRRLFGAGRELTLVAPLCLLSAPLIIAQLYPTRIDHHGWQIATAALAIAALLMRNPWRSGILGGVALGTYLAISIEGAPFVAAAGAATGLLWAIRLDRTPRFAILAVSLALTSFFAFLLATPGDWWSSYCDAVAPGHLAALAVVATGAAIVTVGTGQASATLRVALLVVILALGLAILWSVAPQCLSNPYGTMDPVVQQFWFQNVTEGLPVWKQDAIGRTAMIVFPLIGVVGSFAIAMRMRGAEAKRRWWFMAIVSAVAALTGLLVLRAGGVASMAAMPGAFAIMLWLRNELVKRVRSQLKAVASAIAIVSIVPIVPILIVATVTQDNPALQRAKARKNAAAASCGIDCGLARLATMPPMDVVNTVDLAPRLLIKTPHRAFVGGYHRLQGPLRTTITAFKASPRDAEAIIRATGYRYILIDPTSGEADVLRKVAPNGLMAALVAAQPVRWLEPVDLGTKQLKLYRLRD